MGRYYFYIILAIIIFVFSGCAQINRDNLRYSSVKRGYEIYRIDDKDSLQSAKESADEEIKSYDNRLKIYKEYLKPLQCDNKEQKQDKTSSESSNKSDTTGKESKKTTKAITPPSAEQITANQLEVTAITPLNSPVISQIEYIWPEKFLEKAGLDINTSEELIRALSSTASVAQMRDLLTEPSLPPLLPVERHVDLGCLPPPDSAVFENTAKIFATLKGLQIEGQAVEPTVSADFASHVVKLFEETERTVFLQYALFRLCEMSINSPAEFRNVYPVIIHDIVRRTAEMTQLATQKVEERRIEEEKTKQEQLKRSPIGKDVIYSNCINSQLKAGISDLTQIKKNCEELANSKPE